MTSNDKEEEKTQRHYLPLTPSCQSQGRGWGQSNNDKGKDSNKDGKDYSEGRQQRHCDPITMHTHL